MPDPFSPNWCAALNESFVQQASSLVSPEPTSSRELSPERIAVLVRLRSPGGEYRGVVTLTPGRAPFVDVRPYSADAAWEAEIELPVQVLRRVSGKAISECRADTWIPAMLRVHSGMENVLEMAYKHGYSPIRHLSLPELT